MCMRLEIRFSEIQHSVNCKKGGLVSIRHNNGRDFTANILKKVYNDDEVEAKLISLTGEQLQCRSAITGVKCSKSFGKRSRSIFRYKSFRPKH